ncbi:MAG TPA: hypothetical protein VFD58_04385 [Blastocatellia bacterium]|nr:hypothetical protein [Blastocatellia bacterium]
MKRLSLLFGCLVIFSLCVFAVSRAVKGRVSPRPANNAGVRLSSSAVQLPAVVTIGAYAAAGLPIILTTSPIRSDRGFTELPCRIGLTSVGEVRRANLVLFEVGPNGKLRGAESWTQALDPASAKPDDKTGVRTYAFDLRVRRGVTDKSAFALAVESVSGPSGSWETDFTALMQTVVARLGARPDEQVPVRQSADQQAGDPGSNYCARAFALATYLSRFSDGGEFPAFTCDQQARTFSFTYVSRNKPPAQTQ